MGVPTTHMEIFGARHEEIFEPFVLAASVILCAIFWSPSIWAWLKETLATTEDQHENNIKAKEHETLTPAHCIADAEACWAAQIGKFKHCGLRPNPFDADASPPEYSLEPLDLPLPEMSPAEAADLQTLCHRLRDLSWLHRTDPCTVFRYMRARKGDINKAETYFREAAAWREQYEVYGATSTWNLEAYEKCFAPWWLSGGLMGHGRKGEFIAYERLAQCKWPKLMEMLPFEEFVKLDIVHCMRCLAAIEEDCMRRKRPLGDGIVVSDLAGFTWDQCNYRAMKALNQLIENRNKMIPETITTILAVNAPPALVYAWGIFKHIMDPGIVAKVRICGNDPDACLATLREFMDDDEIPAYLGGRKCIDGDPECRKILAPGGLFPPEAVQRFFELRDKGREGNTRQATVQRRPFDSVLRFVSSLACCWPYPRSKVEGKGY